MATNILGSTTLFLVEDDTTLQALLKSRFLRQGLRLSTPAPDLKRWPRWTRMAGSWTPPTTLVLAR
jgi:hypothetical protein